MITPFFCVILGVFRLTLKQDYTVLGNTHHTMKQEGFLWTYTTIPNIKPDFPFLVSSSSPSGHHFS